MRIACSSCSGAVTEESPPGVNSRRNPDGCEELDLPGAASWRHNARLRARRLDAVFAHPTQMQLDCSLDPTQSCVECFPCGNAPREVGHRSTPIASQILVDPHEVLKRRQRVSFGSFQQLDDIMYLHLAKPSTVRTASIAARLAGGEKSGAPACRRSVRPRIRSVVCAAATVARSSPSMFRDHGRVRRSASR